MSEPRLHHYVPTTYLEGFSNDEGKLFCASNISKRAFSRRAKELAKRRDYNTGTLQNGEKDRTTVEEFFGQFETTYQEDVKNIIYGISDFETERRFLVFLALLKLRSPLSRDLLYSLLKKIITPKLKESLTESEIALLEQANKGDRGAIQEVSLSLSGHMYPPIAQQLERLNYYIVSTSNSGLIYTSDNSVQIIGLRKEKGRWRTTLPTPSAEIALLFPISKNHY